MTCLQTCIKFHHKENFVVWWQSNWKSKDNEACNRPRGWRLSASWGGQFTDSLKLIPRTSGQYSTQNFKGSLNWSPIMPRSVSLSNSQCNFFHFWITTDIYINIYAGKKNYHIWMCEWICWILYASFFCSLDTIPLRFFIMYKIYILFNIPLFIRRTFMFKNMNQNTGKINCSSLKILDLYYNRVLCLSHGDLHFVYEI